MNLFRQSGSARRKSLNFEHPFRSLMKLNILVVDDNPDIRELTAQILGGEHNVTGAENPAQMLRILEQKSVHLALLDIRLGAVSVTDFIMRIHELNPDTIITMITGVKDSEEIIRCWRLGAFDYIIKPFTAGELCASIERAQWQIEMRNAHQYNSWAKTKDADEHPIIGDSPVMRELFAKIERVAKATHLLITGETGVGKELIARAIHCRGPRSRSPFVAINCGGIPTNLFESEFFGYEPGAFTGAAKQKKGIFEVANGGTLFLDEIGELSLDCQVKLLRVLDSGSFSRLGGIRMLHADVFIYAATNADLKKKISEGKFREDLLHRLNAIEINVPPLRERREDIPVLIDYFMKKHGRLLHSPAQSIDAEAMRYLQSRSEWRGNVR